MNIPATDVPVVMPHISVRDFIATGNFGPIHLGMHRDDVARHFGRPVSWSEAYPSDTWPCWKYGGVELYFHSEADNAETGMLWRIAIDDYHNDYDRLVDWIDYWVLTPELTMNEAKAYLAQAGVAFQEADVPNLSDNYYVITDAGVYLHFSNYVYPFEDEEQGEPTLIAADTCIYRLDDAGCPAYALQKPILSVQKESALETEAL